MTARAKKFLLKPLALLLVGLSMEGCISTSADEIGRYTAPVGGAPVISNETPYSATLRCMAGFTKARPIMLAVGQIADYTGKNESDGSGRKLTQGAPLMAMSALGKAGVRMAERFDTSIFDMDLKYKNNKLVGQTGPDGQQDYAKILAGSMVGPDYYITGGITELNFNIRSMGVNGTSGQTAAIGIKLTGGANMYVFNIAMDLRLVDAKTSQVMMTIPVQKQLYGRQISAGVFDFLGGTFFDASVGESALEPMQLGVRSMIEASMLDIITRLYRLPPGACTAGTVGDSPYGAPQTSNYQDPYNRQPVAQENYNASPSQNPYRWYSDSDPASSGLRGRN